ncbi:calmodulin-binding transcription activator 1 isoform X18 [Peromyscus maniculatus bairdii]|uniref:calmodulin-binding transcription activator 1 isoform X18 n=1 Tax=Peromyscus maniculatus bairdii TaxID=230844 RepID=UPI003FD3A635
MWRAEGKWLPKTSRKSVSQSVFCGTSTYCVLNTVPPIEDDHGNSNSSHVKIFLPKKLLECLPKCSSLPKERHRWNTNEVNSCKLTRLMGTGPFTLKHTYLPSRPMCARAF